LGGHAFSLWYGGGDHTQVFADFDEELSILRTLMAGNFTTYAPIFINSVTYVGQFLLNDGQYAKAIAITQEAIDTARRFGDQYLLAQSLGSHAFSLWYGGGDHTQVFADFDEELSILRTLMAGNFTTYAPIFINSATYIGQFLLADGQTDKAAALAAEAKTYQQQLAH
jgi:hypothetical protein